MSKGAVALLITLATAACGRSPIEPSSTADHVEPPGVLSVPGGRVAGADHVEPPGVLQAPACPDDITTTDDHVEPPGVLRTTANAVEAPGRGGAATERCEQP